jgi:GT2 family glycosyltransferase
MGIGAAGSMPEARLKVSLVMPARNEGHHVDVTMTSLLSQTRLPDEIVIADGRSSDDTIPKVMRYADRGVPIKIVPNETCFAGGGRNAATRAAINDLIVCMDFGNRAEHDWLEEMVRPFEEDPALDLLGGVFLPTLESRFERVFAAAFYTIDCLLPTMKDEEIRAIAPQEFIPGGMCMAYRRRIWERAGGFAEWSRKGQDRLFGRRVRCIGGKLAFTLRARVHHHMAKSYRSIVDRHFHYELWAGRQGLGARWVQKTGLFYVVLLVALVASWRWPGVLVPLALLLVAYIHVRTWRKLDRISRARALQFSWKEKLLAVPILFVFDGACLAGRVIGTVDRLLRTRWRTMTSAYLERGC